MKTPQPEDRIHELSRLTLNLGRTLDLDQESAVFFGWLEELCDPEMAALFLADEVQRDLRLMQARGVAAPTGARMPLGVDPWCWLASQGAKIPAEEVASRLALPILLEERVLGLLCVVSRAPKDIQDLERKLLELALSYFAPVVRNIQRYQNMEALVAERTAELAESEARYRDLVEHSRDVICTHDLDGVILSINDTACVLTGLRREDLVGKSLRKLLSPDVVDGFDDYLKTIARDGEAEGVIKIVNRYGETRYWEYRNNLRVVGVPQPIVRAVARDVTERVLAERALRQRTADLELLTTLNAAFNRGNELGELLGLARKELREIFHLEVVTFYLLDETEEHAIIHHAAQHPRGRELSSKFGLDDLAELRLRLTETPRHRRALLSDEPTVFDGEEIAALVQEITEQSTLPDSTKTVLGELLGLYMPHLELAQVVFLPLMTGKERLGALAFGVAHLFPSHQMGRLERLAGHLTSLLLRARDQQRLAERTVDLSIISDLNQAYNRGEPLEKLLRLFGERVTSEYDLLSGGAYLLDDEQTHLELMHFFSSRRLLEVIKKIVRGPNPPIRLPVEQAELHRRWLENEQPYTQLGADEFGRVLDEYARLVQIPGVSRKVVRRFISRVEKLLAVQELISFPLRYARETFGLVVLTSRRNLGGGEIERLTALMSQLSVLLRRARLERERNQLVAELERRHRMLLAVYQVGSHLTAALQPEEIFWIMHREIGVKLLDSPHFKIARFDETDAMIRCEFAIMDGEPVPPETFPSFPLGEGPVSETIRTRQARIVDLRAARAKLQSEGRVVHVGDERETASALYVPLMSGDKVWGVLNVQSYTPGAYSAVDLDLLQTLANQASTALTNARLFQRTQRLASRLEKLSQAAQAIVQLAHDPEQVYQTVHEVVAQLIPAEVFVITLVDREAGEIFSVYLVDKDGRAPNIRFPLGEGWSGEVLRRGEAILEANYAYEADPYQVQRFGSPEAVRSVIAVPMRRGGEIVGVISAQSYAPNAYQPEDVQPLEILAGYTAIALENLGLLTSLNEQMAALQEAERRLERQLRELKTLNTAAQLGVQAVDVDDFLGQITDLLADAFYTEHCGVLLVDEAAGSLRVHPSYRNLPPEFLDPDYRMPLGVGVTGTVLAIGKPFRSGDVRTVEEFIETTPGIRSELCVPIQVGKEKLGVLNVESTQPDAFDEHDERFLLTLAGTVATALQNLRLLTAEQRRAARLEAILNLTAELDILQSSRRVADTLVERVLALVGCTTSALLKHDSQANEVVLIAQRGLTDEVLGRRYSLDMPLLRPLLERGEPLLFSDVWGQAPDLAAVLWRQDLKSLWIYPLMLDGAFKGALVLGDIQPRLPSDEEVAAFRLLADRVAAKLENIRLLREASRHVNELETLRQVSLEITAATDLHDVLQRIAQAARALDDADDAHIFLYDGEQLRFGAAEGRDGPLQDPHTEPRSDGLTVRVARTGKRVVIPDVRGHPLYEGYPDFAGGIAGFPLISGERVIGVLNVAFEEPHAFDEHELYLLELLATQAAVAIEQANLLELTARRAREMEALVEALRMLGGTLNLEPLLERILEAAIRAIPAAEKGTLALRSGEDEMEFRAAWGYQDPDLVGTRYPISWGFTGRALREGNGLLVEDVRADPELLQASLTTDIKEARSVISAIVVPLVAKDQMLGVMSLDNASRARAFTQDDLRLLASFAQQAALAIESSRLYEETRRRLAELEAVNRVSVALREATTVDDMIPILLEEILTTLNTTAGSILLRDSLSGEMVSVAEAGWFRHLPKRIPRGRGMAERAFLMGEVVTAPDLQKEGSVHAASRSLIPPGWAGAAVPILSVDERMGVIEVAVPHPRLIDEDEVRMLRILAEIAGSAIHRSRLHEQTKQRLRHLVALRRVDHAIASSLEADLPLITLLDQLEQQLGIAAADVLVLDPDLNQLVIQARRGLPPQVDLLADPRDQFLLKEIVAQRRRLIVSERAQADAFFPDQADVLFPMNFEAYMGFPLIAKGEVNGVLELYFRQPLQLDEESETFINAAADQAALAIESARLFQDLQRANIDLERAYDSTLEGWARALELRDRETQGHSKRVVELTLELARRLGVEGEQLVHIRRGALLHDIGKVGVPDAILHKPGALTDEEWKIMRQHPVHAYEMLKSVEFLRPALDIPYAHHERWDGSGYPRGLKGEQIPLAARIFAVVDVYDALINERPYRKAWTKARALEYLRQEAGKTLDPQVVEAFLALIV